MELLAPLRYGDHPHHLDNKFVVEQDGVKFTGAPFNIKNFEGANVPKGQRIDGILQLDKKLDLSHAFKIIGGRSSMDFKLSDATLKQMQQQ